jgi:hypothetical protein
VSEILSWWNLIFLLPLAVAVLFLLVNAIGLGTETSGDSELRAESPPGLYEGASYDSAQDINHEVAADHENGQDSNDQDLNHSSSRVFLEFLGARRIPITWIFPIFFLSWGITGWLLNLRLSPNIREPIIFIWGSITGASLVSCFVTRLTSKLLWRFSRFSETYAKTEKELIGCEGEADYKITHESGMAQVYDDRATLHRICCRIEPQGVMIPEGNKILIVGYDGEEGFYVVKHLTAERTLNQ